MPKRSECVPIGEGAATLTPHLSDPNRSCNQWWDSSLRENLTDELNRDSGLATDWFDNDANLSEAIDRVSATQLNASVGINNKCVFLPTVNTEFCAA